MSRFGFNFGRDNKKNNNRRERDDVVLRHGSSSEYNDYEDDDGHYNSRDQQFLRPYRTDDAHMQRNTRQRQDHDDFEDDALTGFRRTEASHDDVPRGGYSRRDEYAHYNQGQLNPGQRTSSGYDQRQNPNHRQAHSDNLRELGFWHNEESDAQYDDSEAEVDRPSPLKFIVAVTGLVFICTVTWLAYRWISLPTSDTPPLIQAETDPYRMRPENPGGTDFPHQDKLIYGRLAPTTEQPVERLLPAPEQAVIMAPTYAQPQQPTQPQQQPGQQQAQYPEQQYYAQQGQAPIQPTQAPAYVPANQPGQMANQVAAQAPQNTQPAQQQAPVQVYPAQQYAGQPYSAQSPQQQPQPVQYQGQPDLNGLPQNQPQHYSQQMAQNPATLMEQPAPEAKQVAPAPAPTTLDAIVNAPEVKTPPADTTQYYLQLGSLPNEALAKKEKERLQKRYASELAGMDLSIKSFLASDGRKKYRIVAGPTIVSRQAALDKCTKLGHACRPVKH